MLNIFTTRKVRSRMESGPMGPYLSAIAAELQQQGYARSSIRRHLRAADHFGAWLVKQGLSLKDISGPLVDRYLKGLNRQFSSSCPGGRLLHKGLGIPELVRFLQRQGVLQTNVEQQQWSPTKGWLIDFDHHLDQVAGNAQRTRHNYLRYARRFMEHLCNHKRLSPQTVKSYRDTFRLLLQYLQATMAKKPSALSITDLDAPVILSFLENLEQQRHNQAQSRNVRLTAIRSFFRLVAMRDPASVGVATRVLAIPLKRIDQHLVGYLTRPEVDAILAANYLAEWTGRRDHALLLSLYNTDARVSEIISLHWCPR